MGDPAGIGPEITLRALLDADLHTYCRPLVIGSRKNLEKIANVVKKPVSIRVIEEPGDAKFEIGKIDVIETGKYDEESIRWGEVQQLAGRMSYDWILKSIDLGMAGKIDGVNCAPISKQAIKLIGVKEAGHQEIYRVKTGAPYTLVMFSSQKLRVFMLSGHLSLINACKYVTKNNIIRILEQIDVELKKMGIEKPVIAVSALNPHLGDLGLFGTEEVEQIIPAIQEANLNGINAIGPIAADSIYHLGLNGEFSAILSLYHDQAHIACKTLDFEKSCAITFGLPFIRGTVDHGVAFDIAGKGIANPSSLIETTRVLSEIAVRQKYSKPIASNNVPLTFR
jgi:4-hydroxythreonine-4-phosphate dehydrogenase